MDADPFKVLGLRWGQCTEADVTKAYRKLALANHPDKAGPAGEERMMSINAARDSIIQQELCSKPPPVKQRTQNEYPPPSPTERRPRGEYSRPPPTEQRAYSERPRAPPTEQRPPNRPQPRDPGMNTRTYQPAPREALLDGEFQSGMERVMRKVRRFIRETPPRASKSSRTPWHSLTSLYSATESHLNYLPNANGRGQIYSLLGQLFFAIKRFKMWNAKTDEEAATIRARWSVRYTMSKLDLCEYKTSSRGAAYIMDEWLAPCMPGIERAFREEDTYR